MLLEKNLRQKIKFRTSIKKHSKSLKVNNFRKTYDKSSKSNIRIKKKKKIF